jgi:hypothetical protein
MRVLQARDAENRWAWARLYGGSSFDLFVHLVEAGRGGKWDTFALASWMNFLGAGAQAAGDPTATWTELLKTPLVANWAQVPAGSGWMYRALGTDEVCVFAAAKGSDLAIGLRLLDDCASGLPSWKIAWREFLRQTNIVQFLPGASWVTSEGLLSARYGSLLDREPAQGEDPIEVFLADVLDEKMCVLVRALYAAGCEIPEPGYELAESDGEIWGMAELAWVDHRVLVLTDGQSEFRSRAEGHGWRVFSSSSDLNEVLVALTGVKA